MRQMVTAPHEADHTSRFVQERLKNIRVAMWVLPVQKKLAVARGGGELRPFHRNTKGPFLRFRLTPLVFVRTPHPK